MNIMATTLGLEEELQTVSPLTLDLVPHNLEAGKTAIPDKDGGSSGEIHYCVLEVQTPVCDSVDGLVARLAALRGMAAARADLQGQRVLAAGLHPFADWRRQLLREDPERYPYYVALLEEYADASRGAMSFGLHLHFGMPVPERRIAVMNLLRETIPEALALSASSPFCDGRDSGMQTWRHALLDRFPRMGTPEVWPDEASYLNHIARLRALGVLAPNQGMWEDLRLHHVYHTLEVRICDATPSLEHVWLIAAMLQCEVETLDREIAAGTAPAPLSRACIEENRWRARRHGPAGSFVDWRRDELVAGPERYRRLLERWAPVASELGLLSRMELAMSAVVSSGTSADQQRRVFASAGSLEAVVHSLIRATAAPLPLYMLPEGGAL